MVKKKSKPKKKISKKEETKKVVKSDALQVSPKQVSPKIVLTTEMIKKYICPDATDKEIFLFLQLCKAQNLNPFLREAYLIKYSKDTPAMIVVAKQTFLKRAESFPDNDGFKAGIILRIGNETVYREGSFYMKEKGEILVGGWAEIYRKSRRIPVRIEVSLEEYIGTKYIWKTKTTVVTKIWKAKPATMIRKVPIVQGFREAYPGKFKGMYIAEEYNLEEEALPKEIIKIEEATVVKETGKEETTSPKTETPEITDAEITKENTAEETAEETDSKVDTEIKEIAKEIDFGKEDLEDFAYEKIGMRNWKVAPEEKKNELKVKLGMAKNTKKEKEEKPAETSTESSTNPPTEKRKAELKNLITNLRIENITEFIEILQEKLNIPKEKGIEDFSQQETVAMIELIQKQDSSSPAPKKEQKPKQPEKKCEKCGSYMSKKVYEYSTKKYGKPLCFNCQREGSE